MGDRIHINRLCRGCMNALEHEDSVCPLCGFNKSEYTVARDDLRIDCILRGKYMAGKCIGETKFEKSYAGWNLSYDTKVLIKEFFPKELVERVNHESGEVIAKNSSYQEVLRRNINKYIGKAELLAFDENREVRVAEVFQENGTAYYIISCFEEDPLESVRELKKYTEFEIMKASEYESAAPVNGFNKSNTIAGGLYVQPARSLDTGIVVKNIASNVLQGASVSYEKTTHGKFEALDADLEEELEKTRRIGREMSREINENAAEDCLKSDAAANATEDEWEQAKKPRLIRFVDENKNVSAAFIVIVAIFIVLAIKLCAGGGDKGGDVSPTQKETAVATQESVQTDDTGDLENDTEIFEFSESGGALEAAVCTALGKELDTLTIEDVKGVTELDISSSGVDDIADLQYFENLTSLDISDNKITDITPLASLTKLERLNISKCSLTDVSVLNDMNETLRYVNMAGLRDIIGQIPDIDYVVGRTDSVKVNFIYTREDQDYSQRAIWVWTSNPGSQLEFAVNDDGTATATYQYLLTSENFIGFKIKNAEEENWDELEDDIIDDRQFDVEINKPGTVINVHIFQNESDFTVEYTQEEP